MFNPNVFFNAEISYFQYGARLCQRNIRYLPFFLGCWLSFLISPRSWLSIHLGFGNLQKLDDILDGDWPHPDPIAHALSVKTFIHSPQRQKGYESWYLLIQSMPQIHRKDFVQSFDCLIDCMIADCQRRLERAQWSWDRIWSQHLATFEYSFRLLFFAARTSFPEEFVKAFNPVISICSLLRDLERDYEMGLINLPFHLQLEPDALFDSEQFKQWKKSLVSQARDSLPQLNLLYRQLTLRQRITLAPFFIGIRKFFKNQIY